MPSPGELIDQHMWLIDVVVATERRNHGKVLIEEAHAVASLALVECANKWDTYCAGKGFDPERTEYFPVYARKRMAGAILDEWRKLDPMPRQFRRQARANPDFVIAARQMKTPLHIEDIIENDDLSDTMPTSPDSWSATFAHAASERAVERLKALPEGYGVALALALLREPGRTWSKRTSGRQVSSVAALYVQDAVAGLFHVESWLSPEVTAKRKIIMQTVEKWDEHDRIKERTGSTVEELLSNLYDDILDDVGVLVDIILLARDSLNRHDGSVRRTETLRARRESPQGSGNDRTS